MTSLVHIEIALCCCDKTVTNLFHYLLYDFKCFINNLTFHLTFIYNCKYCGVKVGLNLLKMQILISFCNYLWKEHNFSHIKQKHLIVIIIEFISFKEDTESNIDLAISIDITFCAWGRNHLTWVHITIYIYIPIMKSTLLLLYNHSLHSYGC